MNVIAIIPARGGSKGIPKKNIMSFCGKPLIAWTIMQAKKVLGIKNVYVSTDDDEIQQVSEMYGAVVIRRPDKLASDTASSEEALLHALEQVEKQGSIDLVVFLQATSPLRYSDDIENALQFFLKSGGDSLVSCSVVHDFFMWEKSKDGFGKALYNFRNRARRQDIEPRYLENGSIYIFLPSVLLEGKNRLGRKIVIYEMKEWQAYQIDILDDIIPCEYYMKSFIIEKDNNIVSK